VVIFRNRGMNYEREDLKKEEEIMKHYKHYKMRGTIGIMLSFAVMVSFLLTPPLMAKQLHFAVCLPTLDQPFFACHKHGYETETERLGIKLTLYDAGGYAHLPRQIQQLEDAMAQKVDAIVLVAVSGTGTIPAVEEAIRSGIPVINANVMCNSPMITVRVRSDDIEVGRKCGEFLAKRLNYKGNIVMLCGKAGVSPIMFRAKGVKEVMKKYPNMKVLDELYTEMTRAVGMSTTEDMLQRHGMDLHGIYTVGEHLGMGAAKALQAAKRPDVVVCGVDYSDDLEQAIREGWVDATVTQVPVFIARTAIRMAKDVVEGKKVPKLTFTPTVLVTTENLDTVDKSGFTVPKK
jgi:ABC-type sugar transport system substrate-binding protein